MEIKKLIKTIPFSKRVYAEYKILKEKVKVCKYRFSSHSKELKEFENIHNHERCFIIGNGPSLTAGDLNLLKNEVTFATNRIFNIFDQTDWSPTYYIVQDYILLNKIKDQAKTVKAKKKFYPIRIKWIYNAFSDDALFFYLNPEKYYPEIPKFSTDVSKQIYEGYTVTYGAIQLAVYMGFKEIYLLGVDFNYSITVNSKGDITKHEGVKDYFCNDNNEGLNMPNLEYSLLAYQAAKEFAEKNKVKIFNATKGGKLEVFERVKLEKILN